jgi:hypothetical protein
MTALREYLIHLIIISALTIISITYVAPAIAERLSTVLNDAVTVKVKRVNR